jgi:hypothetical protein
VTYSPHRHKCLACYFEIKDGEDEGFIKMANQLRYYHQDWRDCQAALRNDYVDAETVQELQEA